MSPSKRFLKDALLQTSALNARLICQCSADAQYVICVIHEETITSSLSLHNVCYNTLSNVVKTFILRVRQSLRRQIVF